MLNYEIDFLRSGRFLIVLGQFSFLATVATLVISARLRKFDRSLEEAALNPVRRRRGCCGRSRYPICARR